jgi:hypothetical protein
MMRLPVREQCRLGIDYRSLQAIRTDHADDRFMTDPDNALFHHA